MQDRYFCILPTSTVYCEGQKYVSKLDEIRQVEDFPVSYTHLDVYKRQAIGITVASRKKKYHR